MRYVILEHREPPMGSAHWDLMLEWPNRELRTFRFERWPNDSGFHVVRELPDHRLAYLRYEGPVLVMRGWVKRRDEGHYCMQRDEPNDICLLLRGRWSTGRLVLERVDGPSWRCEFDRMGPPLHLR